MEKIKFEKTFTSWEELYESTEVKRIFSPYAPSELERKKRISTKFSTFINGFVVATDPNKNFGRSFDVYKHYKTSEGLIFLKKVSAITSLTNHAMQAVEIDHDLKEIIFLDKYYEKGNSKHRYYLGQTGTITI